MPIGTAAVLYVTVAGIAALAVLLWSASPRWSRSLWAWIAISSPFLALSLLLVGHLSTITYATVLPFVIGMTALGTLALVPVARRRGSLGAIAAAGAILLVAFVIEALPRVDGRAHATVGRFAAREGLTTSLAGMLYVSLRWRDGMMTS